MASYSEEAEDRMNVYDKRDGMAGLKKGIDEKQDIEGRQK